MRLFISYAVVAVVGALTAFATVRLLAPQFFDQRMGMMAGVTDGQGMGDHTGRLGASRSIREAFLSSLDLALLAGLVLSLVIAGAVAAFVTYRLLRPLEDVRAATRQIAAGDYHAQVPLPSEPEMAALATDVNTLARELADTEARRTRLLGDVAHEMRTPLTALDGYVEGMIDGVFPADESTLTAVTGELRRLRRLSEDLSSLSRAQEHRLEFVDVDADLAALVRTAAERLRPQFEDAGITLTVSAPSEVPVSIDPDRINQVVTNLLGNAMVATDAGGTVTVSVMARGEHAEMSVTDTGVGLAPDEVEHVFERFYRAPGAPRRSGGSGVGLTISRAIMQDERGTITASSPGKGHGSTFTIRLPLR